MLSLKKHKQHDTFKITIEYPLSAIPISGVTTKMYISDTALDSKECHEQLIFKNLIKQMKGLRRYFHKNKFIYMNKRHNYAMRK